MERFYLVRTGDSVSVKDGATHEMMNLFLNMSDTKTAKKLVGDMAKMTDEEYINFAIAHGTRLRTVKNSFEQRDEEQKWYDGAWKSTTIRTLKDLGLKADIIPAHIITPAQVEDVRKAIKATEKVDSPRLPINPPKEEEQEVMDNVVEMKKPLPKKTLPKKVETATQAYTQDILRDLLAQGKIDAKKYREEMMKLKGAKKPLPKKK